MPKSHKQNLKIKDERRTQILSAALKLFAANGLAATKISDIASASGMSQGLLYHYYNSKEQVYTELIRTAFTKLNTACRELEKNPAPPHEKIRMAIRALLDGLTANADTSLYHLLIAQASTSDSVPEETRHIIRENSPVPYEILSRIFAEGQKDGSIKPYNPDEMAMVFWTSIKGIALHKAANTDTYRSPDPEIVINMFCTN